MLLSAGEAPFNNLDGALCFYRFLFSLYLEINSGKAMQIKDELLRIAAKIPEIKSAFYGANFEANMHDEAEFPFLHIMGVESGAFEHNPVNGVYRQTWNTFFYLCTKTSIDASIADNQALIDTEVMPLLKRLIHAINTDGAFKLVNKIDLKTHHFRFNFHVSGVMAYMQLTERVGSALC